ncbi:MAG: hypothetical protein M3Y87_34195, partial [Myxococcota bacterium]|nr:hypothetical protein [Myxococcota bacterium]
RSLAELLRSARAAGGAVGYVLRRTREEPSEPAGRPILWIDTLERDLLGLLLGDGPLVDYTAHGPAPTVAQLTSRMRSRCVALIEIDAKDYRGVFGWCDGEPSVEVSHCDRALRGGPRTKAAAHPYLLRIDDDRIVPADDGTPRFVPSGAPYDQLREHESRLAGAIADALLGQPPTWLHLQPHSTLPTDALRALLRACNELRPSAANVLGHARVQALRKLAMFPRAGAHARGSVDEVAKDFGGELVFLPPDAARRVPVGLSGWHPLVADGIVAAGLGRLFQLRVREGSSELEERLSSMRREARLRSHRSKPQRRLELRGADITVRLAGEGFRGLLGLDRRGPRATQLDVLLEMRFLELRTEPLPHLTAIVDVDASLVGADVETLSDTAVGRVRGALREGSANIVAELAARTKTALVHDDAAFHFVCEWLRDNTGTKRRAAATRAIAELRTAKILETVQGGLASIDDATRGDELHVAAVIERWLGRAEGEPESELDAPILALPADNLALTQMIERIAAGPLRNATARLKRLQAARRVRWGLVERPRVSHVREARFRWSLEELAAVAPLSEREAFDVLGLGEIALAGDAQTRVELFVSGLRDSAVELDLRPGVFIACEPTTAELPRAELVRAVRVVIARVIRHLVDTVPSDALPGWVRRALRESALLGGRAHLDAIGDVPMFQATDERWLSMAELDAQVTRFGKLWITSDVTSTATPLEPERVAIRAPGSEASLLATALATHEADEDLRLDGIARKNRDRPKVDAIGPSADDSDRALAIERVTPSAPGRRELIVLALHPGHVRARAMHAFRDRLPLGTLADPAAWPALSWVDHPRFEPDRTWSQPADGKLVGSVKKAVLDACERAIDGVFTMPDDALASVRVDRAFCSQVLSGSRDVQVRGVLWIEVRREPGVEVSDALGATTAMLATSRGRRAGMELPLAGRLV